MDNKYENLNQETSDDWTVNELNFHPAQAVGAENFDAAPAVAPAVVPPVSADAKEDWTMDMSTNEMPAQETGGKWQMPEPVFRVSDGRRVEKSKLPAPPHAASPSLAQTAPPEITAANAAPANIQPQPYISEAFAVDDEDVIAEPSSAAPENGIKRIILIVIGVSAMVLFAAAFLIGVYFLFFNKAGI